jgi:flagellar assembly factor FliW
MPRIETPAFGPIDYEPGSEFYFPRGLPGFNDETRFLPLEYPAYLPLLFLQSVRRPELCFLTLPVFVLDPHYRLAVPPEDRELLGLDPAHAPEPGREVLCLAILTVPEGAPATANLLAPLVVHMGSRIGAQIVQLDSAYSHEHPVVLEGSAACS